jgi:hypothetical protein
MLRLTLRTNAFQLARKYLAHPSRVQRALEQVARAYSRRIQETSRAVLTEKIYSRPIPRRPRSGKPAWRRTGALRRAEVARPRGINIWLTNTAPHAEARRDLGTPKGRPIRSPGVLQVDWQALTRDAHRSLLLDARRAAVQRALKP